MVTPLGELAEDRPPPPAHPAGHASSAEISTRPNRPPPGYEYRSPPSSPSYSLPGDRFSEI
jgi:hypothetical protein